ncbi:MAG: PilZ domain-containing protein, partial [Myxococcales bacterium]|nr:PilZ domain-containing protein [Myxococcales bacterium]
MQKPRRASPRIGIAAVCWELVDGREISGLAVDLSSIGLRIERPYTGGPTRREVPLQLEVPGIDEVMWAKGDACFDVLVAQTGAAGGPLGLVRLTGY